MSSPVRPPQRRPGPAAAPRLSRLAPLAAALGVAVVLGTAGAPLCGMTPEAIGGFVIVVNHGNPVTALPAAEISKLFLRKTIRWQSGAPVEAFDLVEDAPARESFSRAVHGRTAGAIKALWQRLIFSGRDVPPPEAPPAVVLDHVRADPEAVGYVPAGTPLPDGVRALRVLP
jgi:hypothetical protein